MKELASICVALAALLLIAGYAVIGLWLGALAALALGAGWLFDLWRGPRRFEAAGLFGNMVLAGTGVWFALPSALVLLSVVAALAAWDLDRFEQRIHGASQVDHRELLVRAHVLRLALVLGTSLLLGAFALGIRVSLGFGTALLLAALALVGLSRAIDHLNTQ